MSGAGRLHRIKKLYMQMFRLVRITATAIDWLTKPGHAAFGKHELRQIKHLMGDLGHPHIFTSMLASAG
jgi:predicted methyltransferase